MTEAEYSACCTSAGTETTFHKFGDLHGRRSRLRISPQNLYVRVGVENWRDRALFDAVQQRLTDQWTTRSTARNAQAHLLTGLLFDDAGHRMVPTHATKAGIRYRYYVSLPHLHGESKSCICRNGLPRSGGRNRGHCCQDHQRASGCLRGKAQVCCREYWGRQSRHRASRAYCCARGSSGHSLKVSGQRRST
jgi:hypothetical protein